jgi:PEP-CTERM motif
MAYHWFGRLSILSVFLQFGLSVARGDLTFTFTTSTGSVDADLGFQRAANYLRSRFSDNVNVVIEPGFSNLGPGILGQAGSAIQNFAYSNYRLSAINDVTTANDATLVGSLPLVSFSKYINRTLENGNSVVPYVDNTGASASIIQLSTANAKALGMTGYAGTDAQIAFSNLFTWDFDQSDGIQPGAIDFVGVAIHELMHAMGFISSVDGLDFSPNSSDESFVPAPLDFTRQSIDSVAAGASFDFTADQRAKYFSLDGGATNLTPGAQGGFSTGINFGDGRQASHWKDNLGWGIMDPTSQPAGIVNVVTQLDLLALDVIGWNPIAVPEPGSMMLVGVAGLAMACRQRNRRQSSKLS